MGAQGPGRYPKDTHKLLSGYGFPAILWYVFDPVLAAESTGFSLLGIHPAHRSTPAFLLTVAPCLLPTDRGGDERLLGIPLLEWRQHEGSFS